MGDKYKVKKSDLKALFATADMTMEGRYHEIYKRLGFQQGQNGNFHCFNEEAHGHGTDVHASMSIDNRTGRFHCFSCDVKGNFQKYWTEYLKGSVEYGDSYTDFIVDFLGMSNSTLLTFSSSVKDPNFERNRQELRDLHAKLQRYYENNKGHPYIMAGELAKIVREASTIPMHILDAHVERLLGNQEGLDYLKKTRALTPALIKQYRLGMDTNKKFIFPIINAEGDLVNMKAYDPRGSNPEYKWTYPMKGYETKKPVPINHFTHQKLYFFEGEPDMYCATAFGYQGAVTFGSRSITDVNEAFGRKKAAQLFKGKEIVIVFDADESGRTGAKKLAKSVYPYAKQVKVIDLDQSNINPKGLDPTKTKTVTVGGKTKEKRVETDYTDFMQKNGFNEVAKREFDLVVDKTKVYNENEERLRKEKYKVTLQEARMSRYFSANGSISLELVASVSDFNCDAFMYPTEFCVKCRCMNESTKMSGMCKNCKLPEMPGFDGEEELTFHFEREIPREHLNNPLYVQICEHDILGLIEVTDLQKVQHQKKLVGISDRCKFVKIAEVKREKLLHVRLAKDVSEFSETSNTSDVGNSDIDMEAYMLGDIDIYPNRSYRFQTTQTTAWNGQHAVLFIYKAEPIATSIETFKMDHETHDLLRIFQVQQGESISEHLARRYNVFGNAAGITGRRELFFINDLTFFSPIEIHNKTLLPSVTRGWVESLIAGDSRCGKTIISTFFHNHYKVGEIVAGSSAMSRTGLIGGVVYFKTRKNIAWGRIPMNDGSILIIDELSNVDNATLNAMTACRSEGVASVDKIKAGRAPARTRKVMLSNQRAYKSEDKKEYNFGIQMLRDLCIKDEIFSRFDIAFVVKNSDVDYKTFAASYDQINTEFTEYQCQHLIMWAYSRRPEDVVFEEGIEEHINDAQQRMLDKFHTSTQLVNIEMRAKLIRMSISLATMLYSIVPDNWDKIFVKKEHVDHIVNFLDDIYCHPNMKMDAYSEQKRKAETLGSMDFMTAILKYLDINTLLQEEEYTERAIGQIFYDYLDKVECRQVYIVDAMSDDNKTSGIKARDGTQKLIGILTARNCLARTRRGTFKKTAMFNQWLSERLAMGNDAPFSDVLELVENEQTHAIMEKVTKFSRSSGSAGKQEAG